MKFTVNSIGLETNFSELKDPVAFLVVRAPKGVNLTNSDRGAKLGLNVVIGLLVLGTICWDGQFYLRRSKIRVTLGVLAEFPPKN